MSLFAKNVSPPPPPVLTPMHGFILALTPGAAVVADGFTPPASRSRIFFSRVAILFLSSLARCCSLFSICWLTSFTALSLSALADLFFAYTQKIIINIQLKIIGFTLVNNGFVRVTISNATHSIYMYTGKRYMILFTVVENSLITLYHILYMANNIKSKSKNCPIENLHATSSNPVQLLLNSSYNSLKHRECK